MAFFNLLEWTWPFLKLSKKPPPSTVVLWHRVYLISMSRLYNIWLPINNYSIAMETFLEVLKSSGYRCSNTKWD